jgi:hypothetical protein
MIYDIVNDLPLVRQWTILTQHRNMSFYQALYQLYVVMADNETTWYTLVYMCTVVCEDISHQLARHVLLDIVCFYHELSPPSSFPACDA